MADLTEKEIEDAVKKRKPDAVLKYYNPQNSTLYFFTEKPRTVILVHCSGIVIADGTNTFKRGESVEVH